VLDVSMGCGASAGPAPPPAASKAQVSRDGKSASSNGGYEPAAVPKAMPQRGYEQVAAPGVAAQQILALDVPAGGGGGGGLPPLAPLRPSGQTPSHLLAAAAPASKPCLHYYPFAGRAELSRLIAVVGGLEMDEKIELQETHHFGSPGSWPCLEHDSVKISQSFAIESYISRISPKFCNLTPIQRAEDAMFCKIKEDMLAGYRGIVPLMMGDDEAQKALGVEEIRELGDKWFPIIEARLPADGFINRLDFPTVADLVVLNIERAFMPFGAAYLVGRYELQRKFPRFVAHANRVAEWSSVSKYLKESETMECDPIGLRNTYNKT